MNRSVLLRLLPATRAGTRLAGVAEEVETGERTAFRDAHDLIAALERINASAAPGLAATPAEPAPEPPTGD